MKLCENVTELIGDTPVVRLSKFIPEDAADVYVKLEMFNPSRSVKDRAAYNLLTLQKKMVSSNQEIQLLNRQAGIQGLV